MGKNTIPPNVLIDYSNLFTPTTSIPLPCVALSPLSLATDVTDATLGASGLWLATRTGAGGTATLTESFFFGHSAWLHGQLDGRKLCAHNGRTRTTAHF